MVWSRACRQFMAMGTIAYPEKTHTFQQSVEQLISHYCHKLNVSIQSTISEIKGTHLDKDMHTEEVNVQPPKNIGKRGGGLIT